MVPGNFAWDETRLHPTSGNRRWGHSNPRRHNIGNLATQPNSSSLAQLAGAQWNAKFITIAGAVALGDAVKFPMHTDIDSAN